MGMRSPELEWVGVLKPHPASLGWARLNVKTWLFFWMHQS